MGRRALLPVSAELRMIAACACALSLLPASCRHSSSQRLTPEQKAALAWAKARASASAGTAKSAAPKPSASARASDKSGAKSHAEDGTDDESTEHSEPAPAAALLGPPEMAGLSMDELNDIAPAGPATAHTSGVVMVTKSEELLLARRIPRARSQKSGASFATLERDPAEFMPYARGPAIAGDSAFWIAKKRLLRRRLDAQGAVEVLASDAREGTRVTATLIGKTLAVTYIAVRAADETAQAKLWLEGGKTYVLSPEGAAASSVTMTPMADAMLAVFIDARTGMTPVHGRKFRIENGEAKLEPDVVVWVGSSAQSLTEVSVAMTTTGHAWSFLPIERDISHFGLAELEIGKAPRMDARVEWRAYPNGLDVAPVATARFCGKAYVAYARPSDARPGSPSQLELSELGADGLHAPVVLANARAFSNVSLAEIPEGALAAYVADRRTWARVLRCKT